MYRINKITAAISAATASVGFGESPVSGTLEYDNYLAYKGTWGILVATGSTGAVSMSNSVVLNLADVEFGAPLVCHPAFVSCSAGTVYLLA